MLFLHTSIIPLSGICLLDLTREWKVISFTTGERLYLMDRESPHILHPRSVDALSSSFQVKEIVERQFGGHLYFIGNLLENSLQKN